MGYAKMNYPITAERNRPENAICGGRIFVMVKMINQDDAMMWFWEIVREAGKDDER